MGDSPVAHGHGRNLDVVSSHKAPASLNQSPTAVSLAHPILAFSSRPDSNGIPLLSACAPCGSVRFIRVLIGITVSSTSPWFAVQPLYAAESLRGSALIVERNMSACRVYKHSYSILPSVLVYGRFHFGISWRGRWPSFSIVVAPPFRARMDHA